MLSFRVEVETMEKENKALSNFFLFSFKNLSNIQKEVFLYPNFSNCHLTS